MMSVLLEKRPNGVAWVTINRPEVLNALDIPAKQRLGEIWREIADDSAVRVAVLTGAGDRAFCAGSDIKEINRTGRMVSTEMLLMALPSVGVPLLKPVMAAMHGFCIGMGMSLAIHCDLRIASQGAIIGYPEVKHGMISALSAMRLPEIVARAHAMELLLMARNITAQDAERIGLVNRVVQDVHEEADKWSTVLAGYSTAALQATKRLAMFAPRDPKADHAEVEAVRAWIEAQPDYKTGAAAFAGRR